MGKAIERARKECERIMAKAAIEDRFADAISNIGFEQPYHIVASKLYSSKAHIIYGNSHDKDTYIDSVMALGLVEAFAPVGMVMVRNGSLAFMPEEYVDRLDETTKSSWDEETPIAPIILKIDPYDFCFKIKWFAKCDRDLVRFELIIGQAHDQSKLGRYELRFSGKSGMGKHVIGTGFTPNEQLISIMDHNACVAMLESPIRYWAPNGQANEIVCYWSKLGEERDGVVGEAIVQQLMKVSEK
jgi:hypothetical protein